MSERQFGLSGEEFAARAAEMAKYMPEITVPPRWWYFMRWLRRWP